MKTFKMYIETIATIELDVNSDSDEDIDDMYDRAFSMIHGVDGVEFDILDFDIVETTPLEEIK